MSGWTPSPEDSGGSPGDPGTGDTTGQDDGLGTQPGFGTEASGTAQPEAAPQPGPGAGGPAQPDAGAQAGFGPQSQPQTGYGTQPGYGAQPQAGYGTGYGPQPAYGTPGYAQPGPGGTFPPPPARSRARTWFGIIAGIVVLAVVIAGVSAYILNRSKKWVLSAPATIAGLSRDNNPLDQQAFSSGVAKFKSNVTSLSNYGTLKSTVSAIYELGSNQAIGFAGLNGTFNAQVVLKPGNGVQVSNVNPGPHGGTAECAKTSAETICQWSTSTTIGRVDIIPMPLGLPPPPSGSGSVESISAADNLMIKIRDAAERPQHGS
jgi:hypothetical protein